MNMIKIPTRRLMFGKHAKTVVPGFLISSSPVFVASFALFSKRSGYVTDAERAGLDYSYFNNPSFDNVSGVQRDLITTNWISLKDALAYCRYHSVDLPSPRQWQSFVEFASTENLFRLEVTDSVFFSSMEWLNCRRPLFVGRVPLVPLEENEKPTLPYPDMYTTAKSTDGEMSRTFRFVTDL